MKAKLIRKEVRITEKRMGEIETKMEYFEVENQAQYLRDLLDIGFFVKKKEMENEEITFNELEVDAHISALVNSEILLHNSGVKSEHFESITRENIDDFRAKLKEKYLS